MLSDSRDVGVAEIGLGVAALGRPGYINLGHGADVADARREEMERTAHAVLDVAYEAGVRAFDAPVPMGQRRRSLPPESSVGAWRPRTSLM